MNARDVSSTQNVRNKENQKHMSESPCQVLICQASHGCLDSNRTLSRLCTFMGLDKPGSDLFNKEIVKRSSTKTEFMKGAVSEKEECTSVAWSTKCTGVWIGLIVL